MAPPFCLLHTYCTSHEITHTPTPPEDKTTETNLKSYVVAPIPPTESSPYSLQRTTAVALFALSAERKGRSTLVFSQRENCKSFETRAALIIRSYVRPRQEETLSVLVQCNRVRKDTENNGRWSLFAHVTNVETLCFALIVVTSRERRVLIHHNRCLV